MAGIKTKIRVQQVLNEKEIKHIELAKMINMSPQAIGAICKHKTAPSLNTLGKIAIALDLEIHELIDTSDGFGHIYMDEEGVKNWGGILPKCRK